MSEFLRQADLLPLAALAGKDIDIVGGGSVGGAILLCLCKMGCGIHNRVTLTDFDRCEPHNLPTQWFLESHVLDRELKVDALAEMAELVCQRRIVTIHGEFTGEEERRLGPVVILAVDSLGTRADIWSGLKRRTDVELLIDLRLGAEVLEVHCVAPGSATTGDYEESLRSPEDALVEPCTRRSIVYTALGAAAFAASILRAHVAGDRHPSRLVLDFRNFLLDADYP